MQFLGPIVNNSTHEKFSATNQSGRSAQKNILSFRADDLGSSGCVYLDGRIRPLHSHRRRGGRARTGTRGPRLPRTTLKKAHVEIALASGFGEFHIDAMLRELRAALDFHRASLPVAWELSNETHEMRISHGHRNSTHFPSTDFNREFGLHLGFAHLGFKFIFRVAARRKRTQLCARACENRDSFFGLRGADVGGNATGTVAGDFRRRAVGIDQSNFGIDGEMRRHPLDAISPHAIVPVANSSRKGSHVFGCHSAVDQQKIVATGAGLDKWNAANAGVHSRST